MECKCLEIRSLTPMSSTVCLPESIQRKHLTAWWLSCIVSLMENGFVLRNRVKELRARLNLRQADLAREVSVTRQTILAIEKGRLNPSIMVSLKIARVLREPVGYIFYLDRENDAFGNGESAARLGQGIVQKPVRDSAFAYMKAGR